MEKEEKLKLGGHAAIFYRAVKMLFRMDRMFALCTVFNAFFASVIQYVPIYFSAKLIDAIWMGAPKDEIILYIGLTVGLTFLLNLLLTLCRVVENVKTMNLYREQEWMYSRKEMGMEYSNIERRDITLLLERIRMERQTGYNLFYLYTSVRMLVQHITSIVAAVSLTVSFFALGAVSAYGKAVLVAGLLVTVLCGIYATAKEEAINQEFWKQCVFLNVLGEKYSDCVGDYAMGMDIRLYGMDEKIAGDNRKTDMEFYSDYVKKDKKCLLLSLPSVLFSHLLRFGVYMVLIAAALSGAVSVGSIAKYVACIMLLLEAVSGLVSASQRLCSNNYYLKRFFSYFDIPNDMYQGSLTVEKRLDNEYYVEFVDVSFRYPGAGSYALRHVNLRFRVGEKLAVVGMNGSGKTTFIKLLCRLYDPTEGEILLNGVDIRKYDYDEYMSIFSVVFQDFSLFSFTLGQNVAAAKEYDEERAVTALRRAGFGERLDAMPEGTETYLYKDYSAQGVEVSGGEAQKIAIARALYKDAPFLVLDEPTAALDAVSEYEVYSKFNELSGEHTAIYISHRLASCRFCDNIVVFDAGQIVQHGSHEVLLAQEGGKYHELWNAQAQYYVRADSKQDKGIAVGS